MIQLAPFAGLAAVLALFVYGISYARRMDAGRTRDQRANAVAIAVYRHEMGLSLDPEADAAPEPDDLDAKWGAYWANSAAQDNALRADLNDYVGWAATLEERFALDCDRVIKNFAITATQVQAEMGSGYGGWSSDIERRASLIVKRVGGSLATFNHELRVEVAECTETAWTEADGLALAEHIDNELSEGARA